MNLSPAQASSALQDIAQAQHRLGVFSGYQRAAPHLWLWGVIWMIGYGASDLFPRYAGWSWLVLNFAGICTSILIARRQMAAADPAQWESHDKWISLRMIGICLAILVFIFATFDMMGPPTLAQAGAFPALLIGLLYALAGIWAGLRWLVTGLSLMVVTLLGFYLVQPHLMLWLAFFGGGTLMLGGLWMRRR